MCAVLVLGGGVVCGQHHIFVHQRAGECGLIGRKRRTSHFRWEGGVAWERVRNESSDTADACHLGFSAVKLNWHKEPRAALSEIQRWTLHNGWVTHHLFLRLWGVCECLDASISLRAGRHFSPRGRARDVTTPGLGLGFWGLTLEHNKFHFGVFAYKDRKIQKSERESFVGSGCPGRAVLLFNFLFGVQLFQRVEEG